MKTFAWKDFLQNHPVFSTVRDEKKLEALLEDTASTERSVGPDEVILRQGEVGDSLYVIGSGSVEALLEGDGAPIPLAIMRKGEIFGEMALIERRPRSATVRAKEPSVVLEIHGSPFRDLMDDYPDIEFRLLLKMSERLRNANEQVLRAQLKTIDEKISFLNAKLDAEHKVVDASLKAASAVFDQTKLRTDEIIFSAERARDRLNKLGALVGVFATVVIGVLGGLGLKQVWDIGEVRKTIEKHLTDAEKAKDQANTASQEATQASAALQGTIARSRAVVVEHILLPGFNRALTERSPSNANTFYEELRKSAWTSNRENYERLLNRVEFEVVQEARSTDDFAGFNALLRSMVNDATWPRARAKASYLLLAHAILFNRNDLGDGETRQGSWQELQDYLAKYPSARLTDSDVAVTTRFERESSDRRREFERLIQLVQGR